MHLKTNNSSKRICRLPGVCLHAWGKRAFANSILLLLILAALSGCARKPWTERLEGNRYEEAASLMDTLAENDEACGKTLEADFVLVYTNALERKAFAGYLEFSLPTSYKFVVPNPLGQPVLAVAGNHVSFQAVLVPERKYTAGSMRSFALRYNLPLGIVSKRWGEWMMARNTHSIQSITAIHTDRLGRGIWVTCRHDKDEPAGRSHLLVDPDSKLIITRIFENEAGKTIAEVTYDGRLGRENCRQPEAVSITGLDYGTNISLKFSNVHLTDEKKRFKLSYPPGYLKQLMP